MPASRFGSTRSSAPRPAFLRLLFVYYRNAAPRLLASIAARLAVRQQQQAPPPAFLQTPRFSYRPQETHPPDNHVLGSYDGSPEPPPHQRTRIAPAPAPLAEADAELTSASGEEDPVTKAQNRRAARLERAQELLEAQRRLRETREREMVGGPRIFLRMSGAAS
ncbi:unnamed protein product [Parascedosporium putredinis]|uniref:Uncharacterized protein n=1 Tax=Parascedosporium putredinis TaxID=1442378 RepID=A0A9P1H7L2_9PEZI|nr:unnamed protein product [Parascedosporium putredinis]CAI7998972.1 unnamed protein product [Parascedosporium putredinis]